MALMLASDLIRLPVAAIDTNSRIGSINTLLVDTDRSTLIGLLVSLGLWVKPKFLAMQDIQAIDHQAIVVQSIASLVETHEVIQAKKILEQGVKILKQIAKTESGKRLGRVNDLLINTQTGEITKYYIRGLLSDRIVPASKIIKITKEAVIVEDEEPIKAEPATATAA